MNFQCSISKCCLIFFFLYVIIYNNESLLLCYIMMTVRIIYLRGIFIERANLIFYLRVNSFLFLRDRTVSIGISVEPHDRPKAHVRPIHLSLQRKTQRKKARIYWLESRQLHIAMRISLACAARGSRSAFHCRSPLATLRVK